MCGGGLGGMWRCSLHTQVFNVAGQRWLQGACMQVQLAGWLEQAHVSVLTHACLLVCREEEGEPHGHITSLAVARTHRKLGLATRLMTATRE